MEEKFLSYLASRGPDAVEQFRELFMRLDQQQSVVDVLSQNMGQMSTDADAKVNSENLMPLIEAVSQRNISDEEIIRQLRGNISRFFCCWHNDTNYLLRI